LISYSAEEGGNEIVITTTNIFLLLITSIVTVTVVTDIVTVLSSSFQSLACQFGHVDDAGGLGEGPGPEHARPQELLHLPRAPGRPVSINTQTDQYHHHIIIITQPHQTTSSNLTSSSSNLIISRERTYIHR
jgi:hypothetical protein